MTEVSRILSDVQAGSEAATEELLPLVYEELRKLAHARLTNEKPGQTLQATALVHEAYLRLLGGDTDQTWDSQGHFFAAAAEAMRRILVENARRKLRQKRGGHLNRISLNADDFAHEAPRQLIEVSEALDRLAQEDPTKAEFVKLRYFAGLSLEEAAASLGISRATASRYWTYAKAWLYSSLQEARNNSNSG